MPDCDAEAEALLPPPSEFSAKPVCTAVLSPLEVEAVVAALPVAAVPVPVMVMEPPEEVEVEA